MVLAGYLARSFGRLSLIISSPFFLITWLNHFSTLSAKKLNASTDLSLLSKLTISLGLALPEIFDFLVIILMLASVGVLILMGRRAELHIIRGAGQSAAQILRPLAILAALFTLFATFTLKPLSHEYRLWAQAQLNPEIKPLNQDTPAAQAAWFSAENGAYHGRIESYNPETGRADFGVLSHMGATDLKETFSPLRDIRFSDGHLYARQFDLAGNETALNLPLDEAPKLVPHKWPVTHLSLLHMLGWLPDQDRWSLNPRQRSFLIQNALAEPLLAAALVLLASILCVQVGTRQSIGRLGFNILVIVVLTYSMLTVTRAFGINGKLDPALAAWGLPALLFALSLVLFAWQDLIWLFSKFRFQRHR